MRSGSPGAAASRPCASAWPAPCPKLRPSSATQPSRSTDAACSRPYSRAGAASVSDSTPSAGAPPSERLMALASTRSLLATKGASAVQGSGEAGISSERSGPDARRRPCTSPSVSVPWMMPPVLPAAPWPCTARSTALTPSASGAPSAPVKRQVRPPVAAKPSAPKAATGAASGESTSRSVPTAGPPWMAALMPVTST